MSATVKDVMTTYVVAVRKSATFKDMAAKLREYRVSAFPVIDENDQVVGLVSETDLLAKEALGESVPSALTGILRHRQQAKANGITAADLMTRPVVTIGPDEPVEHAAKVMYERRVKRLPVISPTRRLIGIVSRADVLSVYSRPDEEIAEEVREGVVAKHFPTGQFKVSVSSGVVTVEGSPESTRIGRDLVEQVRHLEGVVAVRDRLTYPHTDWLGVTG